MLKNGNAQLRNKVASNKEHNEKAADGIADERLVFVMWMDSNQAS